MAKRRFWMILAAIVLLLGPGGGVRGVAQEAAEQDPLAPATATGEIIISCPWFGVGGVVRPGDWAGLRLAINDSAGKQREVLVRISLKDPDGDTILYERSLTTNPGINQPLWMYVRLPYSFGQTSVLQIAAYAAVEEAAATPGKPGAQWTYGAGRLLGRVAIAPRAVVNRTDSIIGVAGSRIMGLGKYTGIPNQTYLPAAHERSEVVTRLDADILPDRWHGLESMDVLVWNEPSPATLTSERVQAIREWVLRGGHLVVVLPRVAQAWTDEANNPLYDIMPRVRVNRREGVSLEPYRNLIVKAPRAAGATLLPMPTNEILQTFIPLEGAQADEAICILAGAPGAGASGRECFVVRRLVGTGRVDMVGLDVASLWMTQRGLPDPELFWNRLLGRRGELFSVQEAQAAAAGVRGRNFNRDGPVTLDKDLPILTSQNSSAAVGVLLGFVVFIAYWLVAGPLGYAVLRKTGRARHGWLAFAGAAGLFTAVAWGGARAIRPAEVRAQHVTFLDHVYGQSTQRARSWVSLMIPEYGDATVSVLDPSIRSGAGLHNLIIPWEYESGDSQGFPDAREYRVESKSPDQVTFPTRSTVKQFQIDWAGGPRWVMPRPIGPGAQGPDSEPRITLGKSGGRDVLRGTLTHDLPAPLTDVLIVMNTGLKDFADSLHGPSSPILANIKVLKLPQSWRPGDPLDLGLLDFYPRDSNGKDMASGDAVLKNMTESLGPIDNDQTLGAGSKEIDRLMALAFFSQLEPPDTVSDRSFQRGSRWLQRKAAHGWDLGVWFGQPCVIIVGRLSGEGVSPVPPWVSTGGSFRETQNTGTTIVRWVYPLPEHPPALIPSQVNPRGEDPLPGEGG